ncbi:MAG: GvpL/GvpF family gas vesicle protein [Gemmatimonadales bacterium]
MTSSSLLYAYAVAAHLEGPASLARLLQGVEGIDRAPVSLVIDDALGDATGIAVLVSAVDAAAYLPDQVEARVGELAWLAPRAEAHDRVVTAAADVAPVVPFPIFSLFLDEAAVRAMLAERRTEFRRVLSRLRGAREYTIRLYRDDAKLSAALAELSERVRDLERSVAGAKSGQRYLLQRKLDEERRAELRRVSRDVAQATFGALESIARAAVREPLPAPIAGAEPREAASTQPAILNASFLVDDARLDDFRSRLSELITEREPAGFRVDFTGPWPAYHFARETRDG